MKKYLYPVLALFLICLISVGALALVNDFTSGVIEERAKAEADRLRSTVLDAEYFEESGDYIIGYDKNGDITGYIFITEGAGFKGQVKMMTGISSGGIITGVSVLEHNETEGIGSKAVEAGYLDQYKGKSDDVGIGNGITAVTRATVTSKAVDEAVKKALELYKEAGGGR